MAEKLPPPIREIGETPDHFFVRLAGHQNELMVDKNKGSLSFSLGLEGVHNPHRWDLDHRYIPKRGWVLVVIRYDKAKKPHPEDFGFYPRTRSTLHPARWDGGLRRWVSTTKRLVGGIKTRIPQPT